MQQEQAPPQEIVEPENSGPFSPSIMKLAQTNELGQPQREYLASFPLDPHGRATGHTLVVWLGVLPIVFLTYPRPNIWVVAAPVLTVLIWVSAFLLRQRRKKTHYQRVYVCTSGLLCQRLDAIEAIHWHRINIVKYDARGNCQVHRNDGRVFFFSYPLQQLGDLSVCIEQAIIPHHLPRLLATYHKGLPVIFGPLRITQQGIGLEEKNVTLFAWDKIQGIERRFDRLILKLYDDRALGLPLTAHEITNVNLALTVIRTLLEPSEQITEKLPDSKEPGAQKGQYGQQTQKSQGVRSGIGSGPSARSAQGLAAGLAQGSAQGTTPTGDRTMTSIMGDPIGTGTSDRLSVVVYERGFLYLNKVDKKLDIIRWDQIAQVTRRTHKKYGLVEYSIEVTCNDKTNFVFPHTQPLIAGIGLYVEQRAAAWALPALLKQYDANETTAFGKLTINQTGITYNKRTLPWREVYDMSIIQPNSVYLGIRQRGYNREWQSIAINKIADVYLLKLLVDYILSTHSVVQR